MSIAPERRVMQASELIFCGLQINPLRDLLRRDLFFGLLEQLIKWLLFVPKNSHMEQSKALRIHELINLNRWLRVDLVDILNQLFGVVFLN